MEVYRVKFYLSRNKAKLMRIVIISIILGLLIGAGIFYNNILTNKNNYATQRFIECMDNSIIYRDASGNIYDRKDFEGKVIYSRNKDTEYILEDCKIQTIDIIEDKISLIDYYDLSLCNISDINEFKVYDEYILLNNGQVYLLNKEKGSVSDITSLTYTKLWVIDNYLYYSDSTNIVHIIDLNNVDITNPETIKQHEVIIDLRKETVDIYKHSDNLIQLINKFGDGNKTNCLFTYELGTNNVKGLQKLNISTSYPLSFRSEEYKYGYIYQNGNQYYAKLIDREGKESSKELLIDEITDDIFLYEDLLTYKKDNKVIIKVPNKKTVIYESEENCRMIIIL